MLKSIDKRLEVLNELTKWIKVEWKECSSQQGLAHVFLKGEDEKERIELFMPIYEAEILSKVFDNIERED